MISSESQADSGSDTHTSTVTVGLSKSLAIPITVKLRRLETAPQPILVANSAKFKDASVFQRLSQISANSNLFARVQVFDGNHNPLTEQFQTPYTHFHSNKRVWDCYVKLPINYNQVPFDAYLEFTLLEIVRACPEVYARGRLSLFDHRDSTLRKGGYKVPVYAGETGCATRINYGSLETTTPMESRMFQYESGEFPRSQWLDSWAMPAVEKAGKGESLAGKKSQISSESMAEDSDLPARHHLFVDLPNFSLPVVFSDITYTAPLLQPSAPLLDTGAPEQVGPQLAMVLNAFELPGSDSPRVYDPDFHNSTILSFNSARAEQGTAAAGTVPAASPVHEQNPIEQKFQSLAININNTSLLDKEAKPSPHMRDELWRILNRPSSAVLHDHEKKLLWKFRYFFSKNTLSDDKGTTTAPSQTTRQFFTKFLKCFNWENEYELDHAFKEIVPLWTVEKIDVGDALELLSNNFNPHTLTAQLRRRLIATTSAAAKDTHSAEEKKIDKIFQYTKRLRNFAVERLRLASANELLLYLLQLVQALKYEPVSATGDALREAPLALFLVEKSVQNGMLGNYFYWYVKVENEDQVVRGASRGGGGGDVNASPSPLPSSSQASIYNIVLNLYIERLKEHSQRTKSPQYKYLKSQIAFVKRLTGIVELLRTSFKKNEATSKKVQFLRDYLADSANGMLKFSEPFPLPLDPSVMVCGCYPQECSVFKSSMAPLKITFKTVAGFGANSSASSSIFGLKKNYGRYPLMFKIGDDLRQDQLVIQIINLMDQLLKNENLNLKLTPYKILATSPVAGLIQFIPNETLDSVLSRSYADADTSAQGRESRSRGSAESAQRNGILTYLQLHSRLMDRDDADEGSILGVKKNALAQQNPQQAIVSDLGVSTQVMENYVKSCAGYCVITYILGVGDRHLDNLLLSPNGKFWHADFGYILGRDPKPFPPMMKLPIQVIDGMGGMNHENFNIFKSYCFITYTTLRRNSNLILNLFQLMLNANIPDIQIDPSRAVEKVQDKFALEMSEEEAILHFQNLIIDSVNAFLPVVIDTLHSLAQYWRA
ncbi:hypothetical protein OXX80_009265 [Metschnikowia pulcherrima]